MSGPLCAVVLLRGYIEGPFPPVDKNTSYALEEFFGAEEQDTCWVTPVLDRRFIMALWQVGFDASGEQLSLAAEEAAAAGDGCIQRFSEPVRQAAGLRC